ncbi:hypothetical protein CBL_11370 [Carabus blaptoides fortunei]
MRLMMRMNFHSSPIFGVFESRVVVPLWVAFNFANNVKSFVLVEVHEEKLYKLVRKYEGLPNLFSTNIHGYLFGFTAIDTRIGIPDLWTHPRSVSPVHSFLGCRSMPQFSILHTNTSSASRVVCLIGHLFYFILPISAYLNVKILTQLLFVAVHIMGQRNGAF